MPSCNDTLLDFDKPMKREPPPHEHEHREYHHVGTQEIIETCISNLEICVSTEIYTIDFAICAIILVTNIVNIMVIQRSERLNSSIGGKCMLHAAIADMIIGLVTIPFHACQLNTLLISEPYLCKAQCFIFMSCCGASLGFVTLLTYDRYRAIVHPLNYYGSTFERKVNGVLLFIWVLSFSVMLGMSWYPDNTCLLPFGGCGIKVRQLTLPRVTLNLIASLIWLFACGVIGFSFISIAHTVRKMAKFERRGKIRSMLSTILVTAVFFICWLPQILLGILLAANIPFRFCSAVIAQMLLMSNGFLNAFIYGGSNATYKISLMKICASLRGNHDNRQVIRMRINTITPTQQLNRTQPDPNTYIQDIPNPSVHL